MGSIAAWTKERTNEWMRNDEARRAQRMNVVKSISAMSLGPNRIKYISGTVFHTRYLRMWHTYFPHIRERNEHACRRRHFECFESNGSIYNWLTAIWRHFSSGIN